MATLPDKPSELIRLALADLRKCEQDSHYTIDMLKWHTPIEKTCYVCLAGAVMAQTFHVNRRNAVNPRHFPEDVGYKFTALDDFRAGNIKTGLFYMGIVGSAIPAEIETFWPVTFYSRNPQAFHTNMEALAQHLAEHGL